MTRDGLRAADLSRRDLEELLPKIREELGPDAIVVRQREGLDGGIGGFFQRRCVEVVARRATPGIDAYDAGPRREPVEHAPAPAPEPPAPAIREIMRMASPFIEQLHAAEVAVARARSRAAVAARSRPSRTSRSRARSARPPTRSPRAARWSPSHPSDRGPRPLAAARLPALALPSPTRPSRRRAPPAARTGAAAAHERALVAAGIAPALAAELVDATISHVLPFGPSARSSARCARRSRAASRSARRFAPAATRSRSSAPVDRARRSAPRASPPPTREHSDLDVSAIDPAPHGLVRRATRPTRVGGDSPDAAEVIDTAAVSPGSPAEVKRLAAELRRLRRPEVHVAVPATLSSNAVRTLLDGFAPLRPAAIVLTHLDEVGHAGPSSTRRSRAASRSPTPATAARRSASVRPTRAALAASCWHDRARARGSVEVPDGGQHPGARGARRRPRDRGAARPPAARARRRRRHARRHRHHDRPRAAARRCARRRLPRRRGARPRGRGARQVTQRREIRARGRGPRGQGRPRRTSRASR